MPSSEEGHTGVAGPSPRDGLESHAAQPKSSAAPHRWNQQRVGVWIEFSLERIFPVRDVDGKKALLHLGLELSFNRLQPLRVDCFDIPFGQRLVTFAAKYSHRPDSHVLSP